MKKSKNDRRLKILLWICVLIGLASAIAWALGWENGAYLILMMMAVATFPLFHFAMHWPFKKNSNLDQEANDSGSDKDP